jgi:hypothetical protein
MPTIMEGGPLPALRKIKMGLEEREIDVISLETMYKRKVNFHLSRLKRASLRAKAGTAKSLYKAKRAGRENQISSSKPPK